MIVTLYSDQNEFPQSDWSDFLKNYKINWHKTKSNDDANIWYPIEMKGYVIWVSVAHICYIEQSRFWRIIIELKNDNNEEGLKLLKSIKAEAMDEFNFTDSI